MINAPHNAATVFYVSGANRALWTQSPRLSWYCVSASWTSDDQWQAPEGKQAFKSLVCALQERKNSISLNNRSTSGLLRPSAPRRVRKEETATVTGKCCQAGSPRWPEAEDKSSAPVFQMSPPQLEPSVPMEIIASAPPWFMLCTNCESSSIIRRYEGEREERRSTRWR